VNPDLYGAWLTASNNLQPYGAWIARNWPSLAAAVVLAVFAAWCIKRAYRGLSDANDRVTAILADQPELPQAGTDVGLYLDCVAVYGDCEDLDRLRDVINQHREEEAS